MTDISLHGLGTSRIVDHYIEARRGSAVPISTGRAIRAIRTVLPRCEMTDRQLADMIAASAIRSGRNVAFDAAEGAAPGFLRTDRSNDL
jgi:hypothetical protein